MSLQAAILGFLSLEPTTGYTLKQRFDGSVRSFWSVTRSQVYRELHALERGGLVVATREPGDGRPDRKVYASTAAGRAFLHDWLRAPLEPLQLRHPLLLKMVFAADVEADALDEVLASYARGLEATRAEYAARASAPHIFALARSPREAAIWQLSIEHGLTWCDAELAWLSRARARLRPEGTRRPAKTKRATTTTTKKKKKKKG